MFVSHNRVKVFGESGEDTWFSQWNIFPQRQSLLTSCCCLQSVKPGDVCILRCIWGHCVDLQDHLSPDLLFWRWTRQDQFPRQDLIPRQNVLWASHVICWTMWCRTIPECFVCRAALDNNLQECEELKRFVGLKVWGVQVWTCSTPERCCCFLLLFLSFSCWRVSARKTRLTFNDGVKTERPLIRSLERKSERNFKWERINFSSFLQPVHPEAANRTTRICFTHWSFKF